MKLGIIGLGHMAYSITTGITSNNFIKPEDIIVIKHSEKTDSLALKENYTLTANLEDVCDTDILLVAVKPNQFEEVLDSIKDLKINCLLSVVTGYSSKFIKEKIGDIPVVRAMPNTPIMINEGATLLSRSEGVSEEMFNKCAKIFKSSGIVEEVSEDKINLGMIMSGSTPAYIYYMAKCLVEDVMNYGIEYNTARNLVTKMIIGAGKMMENYPNKDLDTFVDEVATKGGTTEQAINTFKEENLKDLIHKASSKCLKRGNELGK